MASTRTPGTGGVIDLWKNNDGTPSKLATGRWAEGHGKPQGVGKRWRGWYVGDDGKTRTKRFRTEAEAVGWANAERGKVVTNQWVSPDLGVDTFASVAEHWFGIKAHCKPKTVAGYRSILDTLVLSRWGGHPSRASLTVSCRRGYPACLLTVHRLARGCPLAASSRPISSWARSTDTR